MTLQTRIQIMGQLGKYLLEDGPIWKACKERAYRENPWFIPEFIEIASRQIAEKFLDPALLAAWVDQYSVPDQPKKPHNIGLVMAGNIPLVGFHDLLCCFISGQKTIIKTSSKDDVLIKHLVAKLQEWDSETAQLIAFADNLKGCNAYIATGSNNSSRYFEFYFGKYPNIIRKNRTSVAVLDGTETAAELDLLADDIQFYFGLGCRNITQIYVPKDYDFIPLLQALRKYEYFMDYHKYKHNFDYHLAILIMGNKYYMSNDSLILTENIAAFSPVSQVHYAYYSDKGDVLNDLTNNPSIQCIVGHGQIAFGTAQQPGLNDYADGVDTMQFLTSL
ncbi:MAG: acyl-CoA reductase [Bacteroidetes bacterium 24-39-8]|nr:MAG: acyl-CoA reductase [Sphingobacteriia bacterium 35-40-8]OYZ48627.1 MAG: acyl-CoA reductase [Bacteroidetes bacterium 24-39-8]HQS55548.1 acyl-CoA reductase [Sediminibacterium sp.]